MPDKKPALFGLVNSNRDFSNKDSWGKNQFNSSFPASLACYMDNKDIKPVYLTLDSDLSVRKEYISVRNLFQIPEEMDYNDIFFEFEGAYAPHDQLDENLLRSDLVIRDFHGKDYYSHHEVKLTVLPDTSTFNKDESSYGCEIVIRTVSIVHLAINIMEVYKNDITFLKQQLHDVIRKITNWSDEKLLVPLVPDLIYTLNSILRSKIHNQTPLIINPIWKTKGKSSALAENCLDIFVWSDFALTRLFIDSININKKNIDRYSRALIWIVYLLHEYTLHGKIRSNNIYQMPFNNQTDKAFAVNGNKTNRYMRCPELLNPRVRKEELSNIILNEGELMLSPERRFDAAIFYSTDVFQNKDIEK